MTIFNTENELLEAVDNSSLFLFEQSVKHHPDSVDYEDILHNASIFTYKEPEPTQLYALESLFLQEFDTSLVFFRNETREIMDKRFCEYPVNWPFQQEKIQGNIVQLQMDLQIETKSSTKYEMGYFFHGNGSIKKVMIEINDVSIPDSKNIIKTNLQNNIIAVRMKYNKHEFLYLIETVDVLYGVANPKFTVFPEDMKIIDYLIVQSKSIVLGEDLDKKIFIFQARLGDTRKKMNDMFNISDDYLQKGEKVISMEYAPNNNEILVSTERDLLLKRILYFSFAEDSKLSFATSIDLTKWSIRKPMNFVVYTKEHEEFILLIDTRTGNVYSISRTIATNTHNLGKTGLARIYRCGDWFWSCNRDFEVVRFAFNN